MGASRPDRLSGEDPRRMPPGEPRRRLAGRLSGDDAFRPPTLPCAPPHPPALAALNHVLWNTGVWWQGAWRLKGDVERVLNPTHWLPASTDVVVASDPVERRASTDVEA